jgi:hypothetical protein
MSFPDLLTGSTTGIISLSYLMSQHIKTRTFLSKRIPSQLSFFKLSSVPSHFHQQRTMFCTHGMYHHRQFRIRSNGIQRILYGDERVIRIEPTQGIPHYIYKSKGVFQNVVLDGQVNQPFHLWVESRKDEEIPNSMGAVVLHRDNTIRVLFWDAIVKGPIP